MASDKNPTDLLVYHHRTGEAMLVNPETGESRPVEQTSYGEIDDLTLLKNKNGRYRSEVKAECKRLYMVGLPVKEISTRTGVDESALHNWIYSAPGKKYRGWKTEKAKMFKDMQDHNSENYVVLERKALERMNEFLEGNNSKLKDSREFREFATAIAKLLKPSETQVGGKTQINILQQGMKPLSIDEARHIIANDPIKYIEAKVEEPDESK